MDKILVTGVSGFIGSNLANHLLKDEKNFIYGLDNFSSSTMSNLYPLLKNERFEFIEHDLTNEIALEADYIYHLAGNGDLGHYYNNKYDFILNNIEITKNIVKFSQTQGARLVLLTQYLDYQDHNKKLHKYFDMLKLIENLVLELIENSKINAVFARIDEVYGENLLKSDKRFIPRIIMDILNGKNIELNFEEAFYYTYIQDIVLNLEKLMKTYTDKPIVDLINDNLYLNSDIAKLIITYTKSNSKVILNSAVQYTPKYLPNKNYYDFSCDTTVLDGILKTVNYFRLMYFS